MVNAVAASVFWICVALVLYAYVLYALLIWMISRTFGRTLVRSEMADAELPTVAILIAAYNEEAVIAGRVQDALNTDYPADKLEVVVGSDGSSDHTVEILSQFAGPGFRVLAFERRRGKAAVLNDAMERISADVVVLSDANTLTDPSALRALVRWFGDPAVGIVCGRLVLTDPKSGRNVDSLYWTYETFLKTCEGRLGALLGSNGAIYAVRRRLYRPIPQSTIVDDFVIPLKMRIAHGCSIIYDSQAVAFEETAPDIASEFRRRCRIGAGGFQAIALLWRLLDPRRGWVAFTFFSHKILRWLCPFFLVLAFAANVALLGRPVYRVFMGAQLAFYLAALAGRYVPKGVPLSKGLRLAHMFASMNAALLVGFFRWLSGPQTGIWRPTRRTA
jgi:cellulose synthase/poly-beta-1,6-N-acetylglucosamine synthase-like glycosyltransferase